MNRRALPWIAAAIGGGLAAGAALLVRSQSTISPRVALIGDSYAVGLGPELKKLLGRIDFDGEVGASSRAWADALPTHRILTGRPDIVLVSLGVNDAAPRQADYTAIIQTIHGAGARAVWIEPPVAVAAPEARRAIRALGVPVIAPTTTPLAADGLHPRSYAGWAAEIARVLGVARA